MIRVNRVTVYVGTGHGDTSFITLYCTNTKLAEIGTSDIGVPDFDKSNVDKNTYQSYCKDVVINLLENGGIEGFYWKPKSVNTEDDSVTKKFGINTFRQAAISKIREIMDTMLTDTGIEYSIIEYKDVDVDVKERYKDMNIKYGSTNVVINTKMLDKLIQIVVTVDLRSGQMCKPKTFRTDNGAERQLNITSIIKMYK